MTNRSFCEQSAIAAEYKRTIDELWPLASQELLTKLDSDPETKGYKGTVVYLCAELREKYPQCIERGFTIAFLSE